MAELASSSMLRGAGPTAPAQLAALRLAGLQGFRRYASAFMLGVLAAAALPPVDLTPVLLISFTGLVWLADGARRPREAFGIGWSFGFGFFLAGLYWIAAALFVDIAQFWWMLPLAVAAFPAGLAIFPALAQLATYETCERLRLGGSARILVFAVAWAWPSICAATCSPAFPGTSWAMSGRARFPARSRCCSRAQRSASMA